MNQWQATLYILCVIVGFVGLNILVFTTLGTDSVIASVFFVVSGPATAFYLSVFALTGGHN